MRFKVFAAACGACLWALLTATSLLATSSAGGTASPHNRPQPQAMPTPESWLILPTLPPTASQADHGAHVYRLVCQACHGDQGQGLTDQWRSTWNPADQNCWQSKCHAPNHPPEGFELPRWAPAIMGSQTLLVYPTAFDLYTFIRTRMPWQAPGTLTDQEYWQLTAFLLRANHLVDNAAVLDVDNAALVPLHPSPTPTATATVAAVQPQPSPPTQQMPIVLAAALVLLALVGGVFLARRSALW